MIRVDLTGGRELTEADIKRSGALPREVMDAAEAIVDDVRANGDAAVRAYCEKFDGSCPTAFRVPDELLDAAPSMVDEQFLSSLRLAHDQIRAFHECEVSQSMFTTRADGTLLGVKVTPLPSVGIYVPGGRAQYPSTVLMNAVPAKVAGVRRIVMVTPPQRDGSLSAYTLAAAKVAGVDEVYAVGGAQAVAALAYGTESIPHVAKITGPGPSATSWETSASTWWPAPQRCACSRMPARTQSSWPQTSWPRPSTIPWPPATSSRTRPRSQTPWRRRPSASWRRARASRSLARASSTASSSRATRLTRPSPP